MIFCDRGSWGFAVRASVVPYAVPSCACQVGGEFWRALLVVRALWGHLRGVPLIDSLIG